MLCNLGKYNTTIPIQIQTLRELIIDPVGPEFMAPPAREVSALEAAE
jgi:hypothetical protein